MIKRTITITLTGNTESDVEDAFEEAVTQLKAGNVCGFDKNVNRPGFPRHSPSSGNNAFQTPLATAA